jgi:hypothetical protein
MAALIGALRVSLSADTAQFDAGMRKAQSTAARQRRGEHPEKPGRAQGFVKGWLCRRPCLSAWSWASSRTLSNMLGRWPKSRSRSASRRRTCRRFRFAAGQVGVSQEQLETGLSKLTITLGKVAAGAEAPTKALKAIGISAEELKGKDTGEAFRMISDALQQGN